MPERSSKRKARRDSVSSSLGEHENTSQRTEVFSISDRDFSEMSEKIEKSVSKRIGDTEVEQREILKTIENLSSKIDSLSGQSPRTEALEINCGNTENQASTSRSTVLNELPLLESQHN